MTIDRLANLARFDKELFLNDEIEIEVSYFGGRHKGKRGRGAIAKVPVFGIPDGNGVVKAEVMPNVTAEKILSITIETVRRGSIIYTDRFRSYDVLMFWGYRHLLQIMARDSLLERSTSMA